MGTRTSTTDGNISALQIFQVERVSVASDGTEANGDSSDASISPDGRFVAYSSDASNLVPGDTNNAVDVFVFDRQTDTTERVSVASDGTEGERRQLQSLNLGGWPLCGLRKRCLQPGPRRRQRTAPNIYVFDRQTNCDRARVSVASDGREAKLRLRPRLNLGGRPLCDYTSHASNLFRRYQGTVRHLLFDRQTDTYRARIRCERRATEAKPLHH